MYPDHVQDQDPAAWEAAKIASMGEQPLPDSVASDGERYSGEWRFFYAERRRLLIRLSWLAGGLAVSTLLLFSTQGNRYPPLVARIAIAISFGLFLIAFFAQYFFVVWEMLTWPCPRCAKRFFHSAFVFDPFFTSRCRHCGLLREREPELQ